MANSRLVLLRHGQSTWNLSNQFTGWVDVGLTEQGIAEARAAGVLLRDAGFAFDVAHTSVLKRAILTLNLVLEEMDQLWIPQPRWWRLNERHYGALQGLNKKETTERHGAEQTHLWRRSYDVPPPTLEVADPAHPRHDPRYAHLAPDVLPSTECLKDVLERFLPAWHDCIVPDIRSGKSVLVVAHGNSLRALVKHLDGIADEAIASLNIPTGVPLVYELDGELRPLKSAYLGDPEEAKRKAEEVALQAGGKG